MHGAGLFGPRQYYQGEGWSLNPGSPLRGRPHHGIYALKDAVGVVLALDQRKPGVVRPPEGPLPISLEVTARLRPVARQVPGDADGLARRAARGSNQAGATSPAGTESTSISPGSPHNTVISLDFPAS